MLEEALKAMLTSLPLVSELHHPAMRSRHWTQLMRARSHSQHHCKAWQHCMLSG